MSENSMIVVLDVAMSSLLLLSYVVVVYEKFGVWLKVDLLQHDRIIGHYNLCNPLICKFPVMIMIWLSHQFLLFCNLFIVSKICSTSIELRQLFSFHNRQVAILNRSCFFVLFHQLSILIMIYIIVFKIRSNVSTIVRNTDTISATFLLQSHQRQNKHDGEFTSSHILRSSI